ncbi:MAG: DNA-protecting protein DprA, partial [Actinomycetota bacterium]|nr:DNA-protecting protein DprA [Actinomycetota bacterium]
MTITALERGDARYPELLEALSDPPNPLFLRGEYTDVLRRPAVAVVGARSCSPYGAQVGRMLGRELAAAGAVVVSGLARGVDGEAHRGALEAGGRTVAVLGCGIDRDYP